MLVGLGEEFLLLIISVSEGSLLAEDSPMRWFPDSSQDSTTLYF